MSAQKKGQWKYSYEEIKIRCSINDNHSHIDLDDEYYGYAVSLWYRYFTDYAIKYGVPFVCGYDWDFHGDTRPHFATSYYWRTGTTLEYCVIAANDNRIPEKNFASYAKRKLYKHEYEEEYLMGVTLHELCHIACYLQQKDSEGLGHTCDLWMKERNRILFDYGISVDF